MKMKSNPIITNKLPSLRINIPNCTSIPGVIKRDMRYPMIILFILAPIDHSLLIPYDKRYPYVPYRYAGRPGFLNSGMDFLKMKSHFLNLFIYF